jgi:hypothetical protein
MKQYRAQPPTFTNKPRAEHVEQHPAPVPAAGQKEEWPQLLGCPGMEFKLFPRTERAPSRMLFRRVGDDEAITVRARQDEADIVFVTSAGEVKERMPGARASRLACRSA